MLARTQARKPASPLRAVLVSAGKVRDALQPIGWHPCAISVPCADGAERCFPAPHTWDRVRRESIKLVFF